MVEVRYFAAAAEAAGRDYEKLGVSSLGELRSLLEERYGERMSRVLRSGSFLVDGVVSRDPARSLGTHVDVLPPFSGG